MRPLLQQFCTDCHGRENAEADVALDAFVTTDDLRHSLDIWIRVRAMLDSRQMPPRDAPQPSDDQWNQMQTWVRKFLSAEAAATAGDPGPVVLRRLNNDEYNYVIRDLTGVSSLEPTREFPVDGAAGEGFINTGSAQSMSPALASKYLDAGKDVAAHLVLLPQGIGFADVKSRREWTDQRVAAIRRFYSQFTVTSDVQLEVGGAGRVPNEGGAIPLAAYLTTTLEERTALLRGQKTLEEVARERSLNGKYLSLLWHRLSAATEPSLLLDQLRQQWQSTTPDEVESLVAWIAAQQQALFQYNPIGHIGNDGRSKIWLDAVNPLVTGRDFEVPLPEQDGGMVNVFLVASDAGDGRQQDLVVWRNPRLTIDNGPDIPLSDLEFASRGAPLPLGEDSADDRFGKHPQGHGIAPGDLVVQAPSIVQFTIPAELAVGRTLVVHGELDPHSGHEGTVRLEAGWQAVEPSDIGPGSPLVVGESSPARQRLVAAFDDFRELFPPQLCYERIVPVDEVVTLTLFYRQDQALQRLMLDDQQTATLNRMWDELLYVAEEPLRYEVAFEQIREFATQDRPDLVKFWDPLKPQVTARANAFRQRLLDSEPDHVQALLEFADRAWRRPLSDDERSGLRQFYSGLRSAEMSHPDAVRLTLARILTSPVFLYRREVQAAGEQPHPVSDAELASRLSFFLWSSIPDAELRQRADAAGLSDDAELTAQVRRMLQSPHVRRLAEQFACQWLHLRNFDQHDAKNEKLYPQFVSLRHDMYEETVLFFTHLFRSDGSILDILAAEHTFLNEPLATHYGIDGVEGPQWRRVDGVRDHARGGVLGMASLLASQSGASRTSPILRGNWIYETLLGQRLPRPPANVPQLADEVPPGLTARQLIEKHSAQPGCAKCHVKIDPYGFALEQYDAIGRLRHSDVDTHTRLEDGTEIHGIDGLQNYLLNSRRTDIVQQFCRKLLGYALGREVLLSDEPLLNRMTQSLEENGYRFHVAVEQIVLSDQFRNIRGASTP